MIEMLMLALLLTWIEGIGWAMGPRVYRSGLYLWVICSIAGAALGFAIVPNALSFVAIVIGGYRVLNGYRIRTVNNRGKAFTAVIYKSGLFLALSQTLALALAWFASIEGGGSMPYLYGLLLLIELVGAAILAESTVRSYQKTAPLKLSNTIPQSKLPSISVCLPARNESADLDACLQTLVQSTYPKLEILVLDDCSQNRRTPEIIKSFAHDGVRFIAGKVPPNNWLAKNFAYRQMAQEANGELLLFCGVDARFQPESLTMLVSAMLEKDKKMMSIIPINQPSVRTNISSLLIQPMRYAWELALPRRLLTRPACLSTCWIIQKKFLHKAGGFDGFSRSVLPETHLAKRAVEDNDGYSIMQSDARFGVSSVKLFEEQWMTAVRTRYPQLHRRVELTAALAFAEAAFLLLPYYQLAYTLVSRNWFLLPIPIGTLVLLTLFYVRICMLTYRQFRPLSVLTLPFAALLDIYLLHQSMYRYEFDKVIWKGRNVCIPVLQVIPSLPKLEDR